MCGQKPGTCDDFCGRPVTPPPKPKPKPKPNPSRNPNPNPNPNPNLRPSPSYHERRVAQPLDPQRVRAVRARERQPEVDLAGLVAVVRVAVTTA